MTYTESYFSKPLHQLLITDVEDFFATSREETNRIEFKSSGRGSEKDALNGVFKTICALLNSEGGILIWGAPEGKNLQDRKEKIFEGELTPVEKLYEKDQLINSISDSLAPMPVGIEFRPIEKGDKFVYIFEVQPSAYRPHQYHDKYYVRLDGQSRPAPHYLIEALVKEIRYPNLEGYLKITNYIVTNTDHQLTLQFILFNFSGLQNEERVSLQVVANKGRFIEPSKDKMGVKYISYHNGCMISLSDHVLRFGQPITVSQQFSIDHNKLYDHGKLISPLDIQLIFGGKSSPSKLSSYSINLHGIILNPPHSNENQTVTLTPNYNNYIQVVEENVLLADRHNSLHLDRKRLLNQYLER